MSATEMDAYHEPFRERDSRLPMLVWPRQLPIDGEPADVVATVNDYGAWLGHSPIPKLFIAGDPGAMLLGPARDFCDSWPRQQKVTVPVSTIYKRTLRPKSESPLLGSSKVCPNDDFDQIQPSDQELGLVACSVDNVPSTMRQPVLLSAQARRGFRALP
jgi:hypothetical protein